MRHQTRIGLTHPWIGRLAPKPLLSIVRTVAPPPSESSYGEETHGAYGCAKGKVLIPELTLL